jgi:hypothetical protein
MKKIKHDTCIYRVITTEFWRNSYRIEAENHGAALVMFESLKQLRALPAPQRMLLGVIDPPEEVQDDDGQTVYTNYPPGDDAERMLFIEMWVRMLEAQHSSEYAVKVSVLFLCRMKKWDPEPILTEVRARAYA